MVILRWSLVAVAAVFVGCGVANTAVSLTVVLKEKDNGKVVHVHVGDTIRLTLIEEPSIGNFWSFSSRAKPVLHFIREDDAPVSAANAIGGDQLKMLTLRVDRRGEALLALYYSGRTATTKHFHVTIVAA
jgi:predicted secreted protein